MKSWYATVSLVLGLLAASACWAAPTLTIPVPTGVGAGAATLSLQADSSGTGYFTLLAGSGADCGTGAQVKAGQTAGGTSAPFAGSLPLTANVAAGYTARNLAQSSAYTVCFTAESSSDTDLNPVPVSASLTTTAAAAFTSPGWEPVGSPGISAGPVDLYSTALAIAPDGTPYLAYGNSSVGGPATVMKYSGGAWSPVGSSSLPSDGGTISLAFAPDGSPYISYGSKVMKFSDGAWSAVGGADFATNAGAVSLAIAPDGAPVVAYWAGSPMRMNVMKYSGGAWSQVGGNVSVYTGMWGSLAIGPDGTPYVAYLDQDKYGKATVMKFSGGAWGPVGSPGISQGFADFPSLAFDPDGTLHLAYPESFGPNMGATVLKYSAGAWSPVGSPGFSANVPQFTSLAIAPDGSPYLAYTDIDYYDMATVMKYSGGAWSLVGGPGFSAGQAQWTSLAIGPDGTPYVAYKDVANDGRATVMKLVNSSLAPTLGGTPDVAIVNASYSYTFTSNYATSFSVTGTLPPGISFNTATGSLSGTPTVSGTYDNIVVTATNNVGSTSLPPVTMTVVPSGFRLRLSLTGPGTVHSSPGIDLACSGNCNRVYDPAGVVTLTGVANPGYIASWSGCTGSILPNECTSTMDRDWMVYFTFKFAPVMVGSSYYNTVAAGYAALADGSSLLAQATGFVEELVFDRAIAFTLKGGHTTNFTALAGASSIQGSVTIAGGTVTFDNVTIL